MTRVKLAARAAAARPDTRRRTHWPAIIAAAAALAVLVIVVASRGRQPASPVSTPADSSASPGPSDVAGGLPVGFAHTRAGAEAAAARIDLVLTRLIDNGGGAPLLHAARLYAASTYAPTLAGIYAHAGGDEQHNPDWTSNTRLRRLIVGTSLQAYSPGRATVSCWQLALAEQNGPPVVEKWLTDVIQLDWTAGDWKISRLISSSPGPGFDDQRAMSRALTAFDGAGDASAR